MNTDSFPAPCPASPPGWAACLCELEEGKRYRAVTCPITRVFRPLCGSDGCSYINDDALACAQKDNPREAPTFTTAFGTVLFCLGHAIPSSLLSWTLLRRPHLRCLPWASVLFRLSSCVFACATSHLGRSPFSPRIRHHLVPFLPCHSPFTYPGLSSEDPVWGSCLVHLSHAPPQPCHSTFPCPSSQLRKKKISVYSLENHASFFYYSLSSPAFHINS